MPETNGTTTASSTKAGNDTEQPESPTSLAVAIDKIEEVKASVRSGLSALNTLGGILRQAQREHRTSEKEIDSVRSTLKTLQSVRI